MLLSSDPVPGPEARVCLNIYCVSALLMLYRYVDALKREKMTFFLNCEYIWTKRCPMTCPKLHNYYLATQESDSAIPYFSVKGCLNKRIASNFPWDYFKY